MKTKCVKDILQALKKLISQKKTVLKSYGLVKKQKMGELLKKICREKVIKVNK